MDPSIDQRDQRLDHAAANAGEAAGQAIDLEDQDGAHDGVRQRLASAGGVAQHQAALQLGQLVVLDVGARQGAEAAGGDQWGRVVRACPAGGGAAGARLIL